MMTSNFTNKPSGKHESYFYSSTICTKDPITYMYLHIGPYPNLRAHFFPLDFKDTFQNTHLVLKDLYCMDIYRYTPSPYYNPY
jgi:hypothetical protein